MFYSWIKTELNLFGFSDIYVELLTLNLSPVFPASTVKMFLLLKNISVSVFFFHLFIYLFIHYYYYLFIFLLFFAVWYSFPSPSA